MNNLPNESKNENLTNNSFINKNSQLEYNIKSAISFNKTADIEFSQNSSLER